MEVRFKLIENIKFKSYFEGQEKFVETKNCIKMCTKEIWSVQTNSNFVAPLGFENTEVDDSVLSFQIPCSYEMPAGLEMFNGLGFDQTLAQLVPVSTDTETFSISYNLVAFIKP